MATPDEPAALAYIEKTLADSYRKEIDQEENIWRSLPFFAATLALQLAALFQIMERLPDPTTTIGWVSVGLLAVAGTLTLLSLGFLALSIWRQKFDYVAKQEALLTYAHELMRAEQTPEDQRQGDPVSALVTLKIEMARQYARATDHNQRINKRRERHRSRAGLAVLGSVLATIFLVGATYAHYLSTRADKDTGHAETRSSTTTTPTDGAGVYQPGQQNRPLGASAPAHASRH